MPSPQATGTVAVCFPRMSALRWYRLGEGALGVASADPALASRFEEIYGGCAVSGPGEGPVVVCRVEPAADGTVRASFEDPEPLDVQRFVGTLFPDRGYAPVDGSGDPNSLASGDAKGIRLPGSDASARIDGNDIVAPADAPWQPLVANLAVNRLLRLQHDVLFLHAASVGVGGKGVLACGPKRSGKTTLALSLAARGHALLGDELAGVHLRSRELIPIRRSVATREGPRSAEADSLLAATSGIPERFPDGELRHRYPAQSLSPEASATRTPLTTLLILRSMVPATRIEAASVGPALLGMLTPLAASLWDRPPALVAVRLVGLLASVRVYEVDSGPPDEVADRIEALMEGG